MSNGIFSPPQSTREKAATEIEALANGDQSIEFLELRVYDIHGFAKGRIVSTSSSQNVFEKGTGISECISFNGIKGQFNMHPELIGDMNKPNHTLVPVMSTLRPPLKAVKGNHKVATVLCRLTLQDGSLEHRCPRECALTQLQRLNEDLGLNLRSSFEAEFGISDSKTNEPLANHTGYWTSLAIMGLAQEELLDLTCAMEEIGVQIDTVQAEAGTGQFEVTFSPTINIEAADMTAAFKTGSYIYMQKKGYNVEFMTSANPSSDFHHGFHYNLSILDKEGRNVFVDPEDNRKLSKFGRHWLAGMVEHCPAMLGLCSPTINCYRRIATMCTPTYANWGLQNRAASFRLKVEGEGNIYIENRLPGSACNPHLVLASTVAAGLDGVNRKLELPPEMDKSRELPTSLEGALEALDSDAILKKALGEKMVEMFISTKRTFEIDEFKAFGELTPEERILKEKEYYYLPY